MNHTRVYILGGAQTNFAQNYGRAEKSIGELMTNSFEKALVESQIEMGDIDSLHVGNFVGELFCGQGQLGGVMIQHFPQLAGIPTARHEMCIRDRLKGGWYLFA